MDNARCIILTPAARYIEPHCDHSLRQLEALGYKVVRWFGGSQIDVVRNRLATQALAEGFTELMWIDSDIAFEPASVERLRQYALPLVCGLYPTKVERQPTWVPAPEAVAGELLELHYTGCGFLLTRAEVFHEIQRREPLPICNTHAGDPMIPFFLPFLIDRASGPAYLGEDYAFCERARRAGFRIFADSSIRLQHIGMFGYALEDRPPARPG